MGQKYGPEPGQLPSFFQEGDILLKVKSGWCPPLNDARMSNAASFTHRSTKGTTPVPAALEHPLLKKGGELTVSHCVAVFLLRFPFSYL